MGTEEGGGGRRGTRPGGGGGEGSEGKGEKEAKPEGISILPSMPVCCSPRRERDGMVPGEQGGRDVGEKWCAEHRCGRERRASDREKWQERERETRKAESI